MLHFCVFPVHLYYILLPLYNLSLKKSNCIYLFLAVLGLPGCVGVSLVAVHGLLIAVASLVAPGV